MRSLVGVCRAPEMTVDNGTGPVDLGRNFLLSRHRQKGMVWSDGVCRLARCVNPGGVESGIRLNTTADVREPCPPKRIFYYFCPNQAGTVLLALTEAEPDLKVKLTVGENSTVNNTLSS